MFGPGFDIQSSFTIILVCNRKSRLLYYFHNCSLAFFFISLIGRVKQIFLPSNLNICFGCSKEPSH